ncbi:MAG: RNA helicase [Desulfuromonas sp.]|nr:MAG: RNA helicase [Desulfuromonas sp.]
MDFKQFKFHSKIEAGVIAAGFQQPTPIQAQAIPQIMQQRDVMGLAQTGTGKTAAFGLPILHRLMTGERGFVRALIIAPTRELAEQINESLQLLGKQSGLRCLTLYGGVNIKPQITALRRGAEIVVACPGRLLDHLSQGTISLKRLEVLVLDEADRMFDMGFLPEIRRVIKHLPVERQNLLFSATMPQEVRHLTREILRDPTTVQVDTVAPAQTVSHALYPVSQHLKTDLLLKLLRQTDTESVLVFTRTKHRAKRLGEKLDKAGFRAASLQGNLSQPKRQAALKGFRSGTFQVLVATDIAARGIDVSQVSHVINFDIPDCADTYIHRIGRTGRAARSGDAFTMITDDDRSVVRAIERVLGAPIDRRRLEDFDYAVSAPVQAKPGPRGARPKTSAPRAKPVSRNRGGRPGGYGKRPAAQAARP